MSSNVIHNFGRNLAFEPGRYVEPRNVDEVLEVLNEPGKLPIRIMASRHAWSDAIRSEGILMNVRYLNEVSVNQDRSTVTVGAGCQIKTLLKELDTHGLTLPSVGLIDEQTIAGATATGTHGSGKNSLSHYLRRVRVAHYDAETGDAKITDIVDGPELLAARCSLGLLGVIVEMEVEVRPQYNIRELSRRHEFLQEMLDSERQFPLQQFFLMPWSWHLFGQHRVETDKPRSRSAGIYRLYWHLGIDWGLHLIVFLLVKILRFRWLIRAFYRFVIPLVIVRNWRVTDVSNKMLVMQHELFRHIEIEFFVTRSNLEPALDYVKDTIALFGGRPSASGRDEPGLDQYRGVYCHHYPICIRRVLVDDTLISMSCPSTDGNQDDWYAISMISYEWPARRAGFFNFANFLAAEMPSRFSARCHWGKYNPLDRQANETLYPRMDGFRSVIDSFDPDGRFANEWLKDVISKASQGRDVV